MKYLKLYQDFNGINESAGQIEIGDIVDVHMRSGQIMKDVPVLDIKGDKVIVKNDEGDEQYVSMEEVHPKEEYEGESEEREETEEDY
jgi:hypothetical protein